MPKGRIHDSTSNDSYFCIKHIYCTSIIYNIQDFSAFISSIYVKTPGKTGFARRFSTMYSGFDLKQLHCFKSAGAARIRAMRGNPL
jgi:hypothetical protein